MFFNDELRKLVVSNIDDKTWTQSIMLSGEPGNGKTLFAEVLKEHLNVQDCNYHRYASGYVLRNF
ncbi:hypothetical protein CXF74_03810 [Psychromonas sp. Urea-02u-13]|nr:hypothetical protein CXF74_03810 [Psychromonas sp. Urea-02u-13]